VNCRVPEPDFLRQHSRRPLRVPRRWRSHDLADHQSHQFLWNVVSAAAFRLICQTINAPAFKTRPNSTDLRCSQMQTISDFRSPNTVRGHQDHPRSPHMTSTCVRLPHQIFKSLSVGSAQTERLRCSHASLLHLYHGQNTSHAVRFSLARDAMTWCPAAISVLFIEAWIIARERDVCHGHSDFFQKRWMRVAAVLK